MRAVVVVAVLVLMHSSIAFRAFTRTTRRYAGSKVLYAAATISEGEQSLIDDLVKFSKDAEKTSVEATFGAFAGNSHFVNELWQKKPFYLEEKLPNLVGGYTMDDVKSAVDKNFLEAGRGAFSDGRTGWQMASVSKPRGKSFEEAKLQYEDVQSAMMEKNGTVVFNSAGGFIPKLAGVCLDASGAFGLPLAINMYLTNPGQKTSAPPHTDKQDVFVLQTQGQKHWRVFAPPEPKKRPLSDPLARGKGNDVCEVADLGEPLLDVVLSPGQILYVPAGFPHTTDTIKGVEETSDPSVHLTVGVDTHIWGLNYAALRDYCLKREGLPNKVTLTKLEPSLYWDLQNSLPLSFLFDTKMKDELDSRTPQQQMDLQTDVITNELVRLCRAVEPNRWAAETSDATVAEELNAKEVLHRTFRHHADLTNTFIEMYHDVRDEISRATMNLSFFRSRPYFESIEKSMTDFESWMAPKKAASVQLKGFGGAGGASGAVDTEAFGNLKKKMKKEKQASKGGFGK